MSIAMKTIVPHRPIAAALATPCVVREAAKKPGKNAAPTPPASTMIINSTEVLSPAGNRRETSRKRMTATAVAAPTMVPLRSTCRNSERSTVAEVMYLLYEGWTKPFLLI